MINLTLKKNKFIFIFLLYLIFSFSPAVAKIYKKIDIIGNERLSVETIIMFSGLNINKDIEDKDLNLSIKKLYKTNY